MKNNKFIVLEGICCSGKTTLANTIIQKFTNRKIIYNHGAMSYTELGREFYKIVDELDVPISALYYYTDLICDTLNNIIPKLKQGYMVIQDRYYESVNTYTSAYGKFHKQNLDTYRISKVLKNKELLIDSAVNVYCIPPYEVICERMETSKNTQVHDYYRIHPDFNFMVYQELLYVAMKDNEAIIIDSSDSSSIDEGMDRISKLIMY